MKTKGSTVGSELTRRCGKFVTDRHDIVGPPKRSWMQAPDVGRVIKGDRCAKEEVVVLDVAGGACSVGLARFQLPRGGIRKPQSDLRHSDWQALGQRKLGKPLLEIRFFLLVAGRGGGKYSPSETFLIFARALFENTRQRAKVGRRSRRILRAEVASLQLI